MLQFIFPASNSLSSISPLREGEGDTAVLVASKTSWLNGMAASPSLMLPTANSFSTQQVILKHDL